MEYGVFKAALGMLFFGSVLLFGFWQLAELRRDSREKAKSVRAERDD